MFRASRGVSLSNFPWVAHNHSGCLSIPCRISAIILRYLIQAYAASEMEFFVSNVSLWVKTIDFCYKELNLKFDRAPISNSETHTLKKVDIK